MIWVGLPSPKSSQNNNTQFHVLVDFSCQSTCKPSTCKRLRYFESMRPVSGRMEATFCEDVKRILTCIQDSARDVFCWLNSNLSYQWYKCDYTGGFSRFHILYLISPQRHCKLEGGLIYNLTLHHSRCCHYTIKIEAEFLVCTSLNMKSTLWQDQRERLAPSTLQAVIALAAVVPWTSSTQDSQSLWPLNLLPSRSDWCTVKRLGC